jgi:hypothetical protein
MEKTEERHAGKHKLVYNKQTRTIERRAVQPSFFERWSRIIKQLKLRTK